jgi:hypothetical protein
LVVVLHLVVVQDFWVEEVLHWDGMQPVYVLFTFVQLVLNAVILLSVFAFVHVLYQEDVAAVAQEVYN